MRDRMITMKAGTLALGILAHVDAGKTTLAESMLFKSGQIRKAGRVDHGDAYLDTHALERQRGITIFSKQAQMELPECTVTLLDTPGHVDFSAEMERTLQVLDYAVLVVSGADGVQGHVRTLWRLLTHYELPTFLFINKMDQEGTDRERILQELKEKLDERCADFSIERDRDAFFEELAVCGEDLLEHYLEAGYLERREIAEQIRERKIFPCYFGSALKQEGVEEFLQGIGTYTLLPEYPENFAARVYKIGRDDQGSRLTYLKVTGGTLRVKQLLAGGPDSEEEGGWEEKTDQIRLYSGAGCISIQEAPAGTVCAVTGLTRTRAGEGLGAETAFGAPVLEPVLTYQILLPEGCDVHGMLRKLRQLEEEIPELHLVWKEQSGEIHAQVMGEVQIEILKSLIRERFGVGVDFGAGSIVYRETIEEPVEGVGHFEPLRHYAEVHLLLEPGKRGSGLVFGAACSEDLLDRNWQRLILTHLEEKKHLGVLTGSEITDMKITLVSGRAHTKHTEGGDFRQAAYRAVRQGLKQAKSLLLEPYYEFRLEIPSDKVGRAMADIQKMSGIFADPLTEGEQTVLTGRAPVAAMREYASEVAAYTRGHGRLFCSSGGYEPCHNQEEVLEAIGYDSEQDLENPTGSVFCEHGAGYLVGWEEVPQHMHLESIFKPVRAEEQSIQAGERKEKRRPEASTYGWGGEKELEEIFVRTYGPVRRDRQGVGRQIMEPSHRSSGGKTDSTSEDKMSARVSSGGKLSGGKSSGGKSSDQKEYLLVDGYNIIFAWEGLNELAKANIGAARDKLMDILSNYQGYRKKEVILVFDAYKVEGGQGEIFRYHNIHVVYTKEAETADQYIEKTVHEIGRRYQVTVATSDALEQVIILGQGANRVSAQGLWQEIEETSREIRTEFLEKPALPGGRRYLFEDLPKELEELMREVRLGKKSLDPDKENKN